jgi:uncharacterized membrane protein (UPF0127 family)
MKNSKKIIGLVLVGALILVMALFYFKNNSIIQNQDKIDIQVNNSEKQDDSSITQKSNNIIRSIKINNQIFLVELAQSEKERAKGLGGHRKLNHNEGMLFIFPEATHHNFWMKDMQFDIDILWILNDEIVYIEKNVAYKTPEKIYQPKVQSDKVLELLAGITEKDNIQVGDKILFE